jgi:hypothetical protein
MNVDFKDLMDIIPNWETIDDDEVLKFKQRAINVLATFKDRSETSELLKSPCDSLLIEKLLDLTPETLSIG